MYTKACDLSELREGKYEVVAVNRTLLLILWPTGERPRAVQGLCPHERVPMADARFDGKTLTCRHHEWEFDGATGKCVKGQPCTLTEYPLKIEGQEVLIDTEGLTPTFAG